MAFEQDEFERLSEAFYAKMDVTMLMGRGVAYNGTIAGVDCIVISFLSGEMQDDGELSETKPLCIIVTPEVFDVLDVQGVKVNLDLEAG